MIEKMSGTGLAGQCIQDEKDMINIKYAREMAGPEESMGEAFFKSLKNILKNFDASK